MEQNLTFLLCTKIWGTFCPAQCYENVKITLLFPSIL